MISLLADNVLSIILKVWSLLANQPWPFPPVFYLQTGSLARLNSILISCFSREASVTQLDALQLHSLALQMALLCFGDLLWNLLRMQSRTRTTIISYSSVTNSTHTVSIWILKTLIGTYVIYSHLTHVFFSSPHLCWLISCDQWCE